MVHRFALLSALALFAGLAWIGPGSAQEKATNAKTSIPPAAGISSVRTAIPVQASERQVLGGQWRPKVQEARQAASQGHLDAASDALVPVIAWCDRLLATGRAMVSVTTAEQYRLYLETRSGDDPVDWVDMACPEAFDLQAYIDVDRRRFEDAEALLERAIHLAPFWADPVVELGASYNQSRRPAEALATYRRALALIERFPHNAPLKPMALRGVGFAQVELGDLDAAEAAYRSALELDPDSQVARKELDYIRRQREAARP